MVEKKIPQQEQNNTFRRISRRALVKGALGVSTAAMMENTDIFGILPSSTTAQTSSENSVPSENNLMYKETGREIIDETTEHLLGIYKESMTIEQGYKDDEYRKIVCQELALAADRLNPDNPNLANQIAAQMLVKIGFRTQMYPDKNGNYIQVTPLEQIHRIEEYFQENKPENGYWHLRDLYEVTGPEIPDRSPKEEKYKEDPGLFAMEETIKEATHLGENPNFLADHRTQRSKKEGKAIDDLGETNNERLTTLVELSRAIYPDHEPLARLMATQALLESGILQGGSDLFNIYNNPFGNKVGNEGGGTRGSVFLPTTEQNDGGESYDIWAWFKANATLEDGFEAHRELMDWDNYDRVWTAATFEEAAEYIVNPGEGKLPYATDKDYTEKLITLYNEHLKAFFEDETVSEPETIMDRIEAAGADFEAMDALVQANRELVSNPPSSVLEHAPKFGDGWCLYGVNLSVQAVYPDYKRLSETNAAADTREILRTSPEHFQEITIENEQELYDLPPGVIIVYERNSTNTYDAVNGSHYGHISIVLENNGNNDVTTSSDHITTLDTDLSGMENGFAVFVPVLPLTDGAQETTNASPGEAPSIAAMRPEYAAIEMGFGTPVPEYFNTSEAYKNAIKEQFGIIMNGFDKEHYKWAWEKLWSVKNTNFSKLAENSILVASGADGDTSHQDQCAMNNLPDIYLAQYSDKAQFQRVMSHEIGHFDHCEDWITTGGVWLDRMQEIINQEGPVSDYGATSVTENFADMIMYTLDPSNGYVSLGEGTPPNPIYNGSKPLHAAFAKEILGITF